jgi:hypothetical protein
MYFRRNDLIYRVKTYEIDTRGVVEDISDRSTWPMSVSCRSNFVSGRNAHAKSYQTLDW